MRVLVCSAWPYGYNIPHLGNIMSSLLSGDVFSRYYRLKGVDTLYVSGTDMHGTRAEFEAAKRGIDVKSLLEENHTKLKKLIEKFNISFDNYTSTESETHKGFVRDIYQKMDENGYILQKIENRPYCNNCKVFLADAFIEGTCPKCGYEFAKGNQCEKCGALLEPEELLKPKCTICEKSDIEFKSTKHWFLDLTKLQPAIERYVKSHPEWQNNVKQFTLNLLKQGLKPRAVTRDLKWGIKAPFKGAENKVIYVWAEAALGYISATIEYFNGSEDWKKFWFGEDITQIYTIAKDNIPFHTIFFPAQMLASEEGYHLPDQIPATEYLNWEGGQKFSKSRKVGIFIDEALDILPAHYWRFYLMYDRPETKDTNFSWEELDKSINQILIGNFSNFVNRVLKFLEKNYGLKVPNAKLRIEDKEILSQITSTKKEFSKLIEAGKIKESLESVMNLCRIANTYFQKNEPWKNEDLKDKTTYTGLQIVKALAVLINPFVPSVSKRMWDVLNIKKPISWDEIDNPLPAGHVIKTSAILIEKIDIEKIKEKYELLHND